MRLDSACNENLVPLEALFDITYGTSLELNRLARSPDGVAFVSRTSKNNGVSARVLNVADIAPLAGGALTVALGGSVLETFYQQESFYTGRDVAVLRPREALTTDEMLFYCAAIRANQYRYSYGRQANKSLKSLLVPAPASIPCWSGEAVKEVHAAMALALDHLRLIGGNSIRTSEASVDSDNDGDLVSLDSLFDITYGTSLELNRLEKASEGVNFISRTSKNNGVSAVVVEVADVAPIAPEALTVALGGSVLETFYQRLPFYTGFHVAVLRPIKPMTPEELLFYCAAIRANQYRYSYGRQANKTLKTILVPARQCIPAWVHGAIVRVCDQVQSQLPAETTEG